MMDFNSLIQASQQQAALRQRQQEELGRIKALLDLYESAMGQGAVPSMHATTDQNDPNAPLFGADQGGALGAITPDMLTGAVNAGINPQPVTGVAPPPNPGAMNLSGIVPAPDPQPEIPWRPYELSNYGGSGRSYGPGEAIPENPLMTPPSVQAAPLLPAELAVPPAAPAAPLPETPLVTNPPTTAAASAEVLAAPKSTVESLAGMRFENAIASVVGDKTLQDGAKTAILEALVSRQVESAKNAAVSPFANVVPQDWDKDVDWAKLGVSRTGGAPAQAGPNQPVTASGSQAQTTQTPNVAGAKILADAQPPAQDGMTFDLGAQLGDLNVNDAINAVQQGEGVFLYVSQPDRQRMVTALQALRTYGQTKVPKDFGKGFSFALRSAPQNQSTSPLSGSVKPEERQMK